MSFLEVRNVSKAFEEETRRFTLLGDVSFSVEKEEFVCITGPSGCGKTELLRIISGIEKPSGGQVLFEEKPISIANPRVANVFQNFALLPWMTVLQNVELGLYAQNFPEEKRKGVAEKYLRIVGLEGFENAYPRELSGGTKQRVGIARALAVEPSLLCLDEPFSSLDSLTAASLREELLLLWQDPSLPPDSIVMVTHNVEEAVYMADRIIVLSNPPTRIAAQLKISLPRPRDPQSEEFVNDADKVYSLLT